LPLRTNFDECAYTNHRQGSVAEKGQFFVTLRLATCFKTDAFYRTRFCTQDICPMKTRIFVTLKNGVLDPQGKAIHHALEALGFEGVNDVRAGRLIEIDHEPGLSDADLEAMCRTLLANMVIENFEIEQA
jgi:phosphoribosylformylglycinamidine synthase subunit PurS